MIGAAMANLDAEMERLGAYPVRPASRRDPGEAEIADFERELGGRLPADYRAFLLRHGQQALRRGGVFTLQEPCPLGEAGQVGTFFGFTTDGEGIVEATLDTFAGRIPDETIPIADDGRGNLILLGFDGSAAGKVWLWDHEHRELAGRFDEIVADVKAKDVDTSRLDPHAIIWQWERLYPEKREKAPGYGNLYLLAESFSAFLTSLRAISSDEAD